jgi:hypothetical protein
MPPDILYPPLHHGTERAVIDKTGHRPVTLRSGPDKAPALGQIHHILKNITHAGSLESSLIWLHHSRQKGSRPGSRTQGIFSGCLFPGGSPQVFCLGKFPDCRKITNFRKKTGGWEMAIQTEIKGFWSKTP